MKYLLLITLVICSACATFNQTPNKNWVQDDLYCWKYDKFAEKWVVVGLNNECPQGTKYQVKGP